jgi:FAD/FMN-containing dehydrogenase/Fe-S oxidoreductase
VDERLARIYDDLRGVIEGDLLFDELSRALYSTDASIYRIPPLGVVVPRHSGDVVATVKYAAENRIPIVARGAGTGLAGECLGPGLVLDFSRYMRHVEPASSDTVRVQPGAVYDRVNRMLAGRARMLAVDPASGDRCTLGGMVANNASGARSVKYGYTRDYLVNARVVLANGQELEVGDEPRWTDLTATSRAPVKQQLVDRLSALIEGSRDLITRRQPRALHNRCGYLLHDVLTPERLALGRLLVGTEGTLALFTEATLRTVTVPQFRAVAMLVFDRLEAAMQAVFEVMTYGPSACELLDRRILTLVRDAAPLYRDLVPPGAEAILLVEQEAEDDVEVRNLLRLVVNRVRRVRRLAIEAREAYEPDEIRRLWEVRDVAATVLIRLKGPAQPVPFVEDIAVPVEQLPVFVRRLQQILKDHLMTASLFAHAGHGQLHVRPFLDLRSPADVGKMQPLAHELYAAALELGGTISGEHAVGCARTPFVQRQYGELYDVFRRVKGLFDPQNLFNPGKIVDGAAAPQLTGNLRYDTRPQLIQLDARLRWATGEMAEAALSCNGCGKCRTHQLPVRMCPIFRVDPSESATPRAKANVMRQLLSGELAADWRFAPEFKRVADQCVNCKMCRSECPTRVNIPKLMLEAKAAYAAQNGLNMPEWFVSRVELWERLASATSLAANWVVQNPAARWLLGKLFGLAPRRKLPRFHLRTFLKRARRAGLTRRPRGNGPRAAYFVDLWANYNDPQLAEAVVAVLQHNGVQVYVPPDQLGCGMPLVNSGDVDAVLPTVRHNVRLLVELVRQDYTIVCSEPSAALMLTQDHLDINDDPDTRLVAARTKEVCQYLVELHQRGQLRTDFCPLPISLGYHAPCHLLALQAGLPGLELLRLIPQIRLHHIDAGCSGMAGTFGLIGANFETSLQAGDGLFHELDRTDIQFGATECSTCKMQMEQGVTKRTLHPIKLLAYSYGLLPRLERQLLATAPNSWVS